MTGCRIVTRPLCRQLGQKCVIRTFSRSAVLASETTTTTTTTTPTTTPTTGPTYDPALLKKLPPVPKKELDPNSVPRVFEGLLLSQGISPIGSRRRRQAIRTTGDLPFEQLPYQAFQEALKFLAVDRAQKLDKLKVYADKIAALEALDAGSVKGGEVRKRNQLLTMRREARRLAILADINDPLVKRRFEDGLGDMTKPIYRHLAEAKWRAYPYKIIKQRIQQFKIVPDVLPKLDPVMDVQLYFDEAKTPPGSFVNSHISERPPRLRAQAFDDKAERLVTVVVLDADVPDLESDSFRKRCIYVAANLPLSPSLPNLNLPLVNAPDQLAVPWSPPYATKGSPYHRIAVFVLEQPQQPQQQNKAAPVAPAPAAAASDDDGAQQQQQQNSVSDADADAAVAVGDAQQQHQQQQQPQNTVDVARMRELYADHRDGFSLKSFRDKFGLVPVGFNMFRSIWDEQTAEVMARHGFEGAELELRPRRVYSLRPPRRPRGWEARHQGPKYRHLDKYTKRIRGISNARGWTKRF